MTKVNFTKDMISPTRNKITFPAGNKVIYQQDFYGWIGMPSDVEFTIEVIDKNHAILSAPGYGGEPYGNGKIYIYRSLQKGAPLFEVGK